MAFNYNKLLENNLSANEYVVLLIVKSKDYDSLLSLFNNEVAELLENGWLTVTKEFEGKPNYLKGVRTTKKANTLLVEVLNAEITEESKKLCEDIIDTYQHKGYDSKVGNNKKILSLCSWFLAETEISPSDILETIDKYLDKTEEKYVRSVENLIWKPKSVFATKWTLDDSLLYCMCKI